MDQAQQLRNVIKKLIKYLKATSIRWLFLCPKITTLGFFYDFTQLPLHESSFTYFYQENGIDSFENNRESCVNHELSRNCKQLQKFLSK